MSKLIFITGGVRSGKSAFAENYAKQLYHQFVRRNLYYIASGVAFDEEMADRIKRHQEDREKSVVKWSTVEIHNELKFEVDISATNSVILWDCITTWLSNILYSTEQLDVNTRKIKIDEYIETFKKQLLLWAKDNAIVLLVSNEILDEPNSTFYEVNYYRYLLGELHQWIVKQSDEAYEMDYSILKRWK